MAEGGEVRRGAGTVISLFLCVLRPRQPRPRIGRPEITGRAAAVILEDLRLGVRSPASKTNPNQPPATVRNSLTSDSPEHRTSRVANERDPP